MKVMRFCPLLLLTPLACTVEEPFEESQVYTRALPADSTAAGSTATITVTADTV